MRANVPGGAFIFAILTGLLFACSDSSGTEAASNDADIPCEPRRVLKTVCQQCHSDPPKNGAPFPLVTRTDILAVREDTGVRENMIAQVEAGRMPVAPVTISDGDRAILLDWLREGAPAAPAQDCSSVAPNGGENSATGR